VIDIICVFFHRSCCQLRDDGGGGSRETMTLQNLLGRESEREREKDEEKEVT
jgi:hypothetical protein